MSKNEQFPTKKLSNREIAARLNAMIGEGKIVFQRLQKPLVSGPLLRRKPDVRRLCNGVTRTGNDG